MLALWVGGGGRGGGHLHGHEGAQLINVGHGLALLHLVPLHTWPRHSDTCSARFHRQGAVNQQPADGGPALQASAHVAALSLSSRKSAQQNQPLHCLWGTALCLCEYGGASSIFQIACAPWRWGDVFLAGRASLLTTSTMGAFPIFLPFT